MNEFIYRFDTICQIHPNNTAISVDNEYQISYASLLLKAQQVAQQLKHYQIGPGHLVALNLNKSPEYIIALLGVWMAGAAFMPLDPSLPQARQDYYCEQAKPNLIINSDLNCTLLHIQTQYDKQLAYIIFTSGSTGLAKGVLISHKGIVNFLEQQIQLFQLTSTSRNFFYLSTQFDASISDIGTTLLSGASLCLSQKNSADLIAILQEQHISHIDLPPSVLSSLDYERMPESVQTIIIGGETCASTVVKKWAKKFRLINIYGPTEATVCTSMMVCTKDFEYGCIGNPIAGIEYLILDSDNKPAQHGELYIAGLGLALGYLGQEELNAAKFLTISNKQYYRTGDLVSCNHQGTYYYLGRIDRQVKIRGQLVEPEEIEAALYTHPAVQCAAVFIEETDGKKQIIAAVEAPTTTAAVLTYFLKSLLPTWLIPNRLYLLASLPKNTNGKIDYANIKTHTLIPATPAEHALTLQLQHIFQQVLKLTNLPAVHAHLINELGANSLDLINLIVQLEKNGLFCSIALLHHLPSIHDIANWFESNTEHASDGLSTSILKRECELNLQVAQTPLLTGATGFLGIHLLDELLKNTHHPINCLIRANSKEQALAKIQKTAHSFGISLVNNRLQIILGDLSQAQFGLSANQWNELATSTNHIYHCAAEVHMTKTFADLKPVNLEGTKEIARLARATTTQRLSYISTLSVFVASDQNTGICKENDTLATKKTIYGGYAQSKWAAEYFLRQTSLNLSIFRLGLITGHSVSGLSSEHDFLMQFIKGLNQLPTIPDGPWNTLYVDATPVDYAARAIIYLANNAPAQCYHIVNKQGFSLAGILKIMKKHPVSTHSNTASSELALCRLLPDSFDRFRTMDLFQATDIVFDQENTLKHLANTDIRCPVADDALLEKYCSFLEVSDSDAPCFSSGRKISGEPPNAPFSPGGRRVGDEGGVSRHNAAPPPSSPALLPPGEKGALRGSLQTLLPPGEKGALGGSLQTLLPLEQQGTLRASPPTPHPASGIGLVLGKFMPLHKGHELLLQFANNYVATLYVVVDNILEDPYCATKRCLWIQELLPHAQVFYLPKPNPQQPQEHPDFWEIWRSSLVQLLPQKPDYLFASEEYGSQLAEIVQAQFIPCDLKRELVPISASHIRQQPLTHWQYLSKPAKLFHLKRICIFGPESSGKTTLSQALAKHYQTQWVPEYARLFLETKLELKAEHMLQIAKGQSALEKSLAPSADKLLFCDTDPLATVLWNKWLFNQDDPALNQLALEHDYDLYLLLSPDLNWQADPVRFFPEQSQEFFNDCIQLLQTYKRRYVVISGKNEARLSTAITSIDEFLLCLE
ncbi:MAG: amino acid adenylation domain-containing protein [Legionella sp.]|jgi:NadR type nicotinamide-nucleotide adenylyltransferase